MAGWISKYLMSLATAAAKVDSDTERELMRYQYAPLPDGQSFRILNLQSDEPTNPLIGQLHTHQLQRPPSGKIVSKPAGLATPLYEAVSYVWGDPSLSSHIKCDGKSIPITSSLDIALRRLRKSDSMRAVWVEQLCLYSDRYRTKCLTNLRF